MIFDIKFEQKEILLEILVTIAYVNVKVKKYHKNYYLPTQEAAKPSDGQRMEVGLNHVRFNVHIQYLYLNYGSMRFTFVLI